MPCPFRRWFATKGSEDNAQVPVGSVEVAGVGVEVGVAVGGRKIAAVAQYSVRSVVRSRNRSKSSQIGK